MSTSNGFYVGYKDSGFPDTDFIINLFTGLIYTIDDEQNARKTVYRYGTLRERTELINAVIADTETPEHIIPLFAGNNPVGNIIDYDPHTETGIWEL